MENKKKKTPQKWGRVLKRAVCGRWALGIGWPPVPRVHSLSWKASNGSLVPWAQWDKGTVPKSLGWGLSACHPFTLPQTRPFLSHTISTCATNKKIAQGQSWLRIIRDIKRAKRNDFSLAVTISPVTGEMLVWGAQALFWLISQSSSCSVSPRH